jgi:hypothetical protein
MVRLYTEDVRRFADAYAAKFDLDGIRTRLDNLRIIVKGYSAHENYIDHLKTILTTELITALPSEFRSICDGFKPFKASMSMKFGAKKFYELVVEALEYDNARGYFRCYVPLMGIKTCVYCNAQYAVTFVKRDGKEYAQFEVDHWMSKNKYPCLSISFYNFVPCCPSCNKHKSSKPLSFSLYTEVPKVIASGEYNPFVFRIPDINLSRYLATFNPALLKMEFKSRFSDSSVEKDYDRFAINEMYELFHDEAALTLQRFLFYSDAYREQLKTNYSKLFKSGGIPFDEFIYGARLNQSDVLSRPLGKMTQDIRAQLETSSLYSSWLKKKGII